MFSFNFQLDAPARKKQDEGQHAADAQPAPSYDAPAIEEVYKDQSHAVPVEMLPLIPGLSLAKGMVSNRAAAGALNVADVEQNDLLPGRYEGGFKQWEGGVDLAQFLALHSEQLLAPASASSSSGAGSGSGSARRDGSDAPSGSGSGGGGSSGSSSGGGSSRSKVKVLELGCGHGLPGLVALHEGSEVHFQDYNPEVLHTLTMPNVGTNWRAWRAAAGDFASPAPPPARFFSGSWAGLPALLESLSLAGTYDLILTAETIYSPEGSKMLLQAIKAALSKPGGTALVAAKSYYFGCGGSSAGFQQLVLADGELEAETAWSLDDGRSNARCILRLAWRQ